MDETINVIEQKFNGESYIFLKRIEYNNENYSVFFKLDNPDIIIVAKEVIKDTTEGYEIVSDDEYIDILSRINCEN